MILEYLTFEEMFGTDVKIRQRVLDQLEQQSPNITPNIWGLPKQLIQID